MAQQKREKFTARVFNSSSWVTCPRHNPQAKMRLFCFPYAGGRALIFRPWFEQLPPTVEVCPLELPGRGKRLRESLFTQLSPLVRALAPALLPYLDKPFAFFGHSMGGLISFELACLLSREYGFSPVHLFVSGCRAPQLPARQPLIHRLPEPLFMERLRYLSGTPEGVLANDELRQLFLPILRADFTILETYTYTPESRLNCPISVFGGLQDPEVSFDELEAWREQTNTAFSLQMLPGDHFFLHSAQSQIIQYLVSHLDWIVREVIAS